MVNTHKSNDISSICYAILEELSKTDNYPIKKCQNCGMYFIPNLRLDESYCDYLKENGKTCREQGAILSYNKRLQEKSAYTEYRKTYQQKFGVVNKNILFYKGNICERRNIYMNNADLVWLLVELLLQKENDLKQVALDQAKNDSKPNDQRPNEV